MSLDARPNLFKDLRFPIELGIIPVKLVLLTSNFVKLLCDEKFGNEPETSKLYLISISVKFLFWKILTGNRPLR